MLMASRPAKRQRRSVIVQSDESGSDDDAPGRVRSNSKASGSRLPNEKAIESKQVTPRKRSFRDISVTASPKSSPEKARKVSKKVEAPNKSLHSFFGRATEEQRWKRKSATPEVEIHDQIEDDISDNDSINNGPSKAAAGEKGFQNRLKQEIPSSSQKFVKPPLPGRSFNSQSSAPDVQSEVLEQKPWADRYGPENLEELAVHKRKAGDVQNWLQDALAGRVRQRLLVIKGPAGSGKTTTIYLLAKQLGIKIVPWINSTVSEAGAASNIQQFGDFLNRGGGYNSLQFRDDSSSTSVNHDSSPRLLLVEDLPMVTSRVSNILNSFRASILEYLASSFHHAPFGKPLSTQPPVVILISETFLSSSTALSDSFTAHRLLGTEIAIHPATTTMEFNPIAPTFIQKALDLVVKKEARDSKRRRTPGPKVLQELAKIGDIRSAVNSLEFLCTRGDEDSDWSGTVAGRAKKKDSVPLTEAEKNTLKLISQRESTLGMFHATGKIVYNKREDPRVLDTRAAPPPKPPDHLLYLYSPKASQVDIEALFGETGTDIQTFLSTLHHNYVLSCNGDDFVDSLDGCATILSDSDVLNPESRNLIRGKGNVNTSAYFVQSGNTDMLRQDEISFQTACRGLLFNLPFPVSRATIPGQSGQAAFRMLYPTSLKIWRQTEEIYDLISTYMNVDLERLHNGSITALRRHDATNGVSSWRSRGFGSSGASSEFDFVEMESDLSTVKAVASRDTYVLDILPYLTMIKTDEQRTTQPSQHLRNLQKITVLTGIDPIQANQESDEEDQVDEADSGGHMQDTPARTPKSSRTKSLFTTDTSASRLMDAQRLSFGQKVQAAHDSIRTQQQQQQQQHKTKPLIQAGSSSELQQSVPMESLYLSDDDISD